MSTSSKYIAKQVASFERMVKLETETEDPHLKRIVTNVRRHVALEVGWERFTEAMDPEWMVEQPQYVGSMPIGGTGHWSGMEQVRMFYDQFKGGDLFTAVNKDVYLARNGIANTMDVGFYVTADALPALVPAGILEAHKDVVDDDDAMYAVSSYMVSFWPMDEQARLTGEEFYHTGDISIEKMAPEDVFTREELTESCRPYMDA
jgi:hypothetical protein